MIKFAFGWMKNNKIYVTIYSVAVISMCVITLLLANFFVNESFYGNDNDERKYGFIFYEEISYDDMMCLIEDVSIGLELPEKVTLVSNTQNYYDDFGIMTTINLKENEVDSENLVYGYYSDERNTYVSFSEYEQLVIGDKTFEKTGQGCLLCAGNYVSYCITQDDYKECNLMTQGIEFYMENVLVNEEEEKLKEIVKLYCDEFEYVHLSGFSLDGLESIMNTLLIAFVLFCLACFSVLVFLEIALYLQETDIKVLRLYGATRTKIEQSYIMVNLILLFVCFGMGILIAKIIVSNLNCLAVIIDAAFVFVVYSIFTVLYIKKTVSHVDTVHKKVGI